MSKDREKFFVVHFTNDNYLPYGILFSVRLEAEILLSQLKLLNLAKHSAKEIFKLIRNDGSVFCEDLNAEVKITRKFLQHICFHHHKDRTAQEIMERILIMPFAREIIQKGKCVERRKEHGMIFTRISYYFKNKYTLSVVLKQNEESDLKYYNLLSCFRNTKKRLVSASRTGTSSQKRFKSF